MTYQEAMQQIKNTIPDNQIMISQKEVSILTGISITALNKDAKENQGIPHKRVRSKIYYAVIDLAKWLSSNQSKVI